VSSDGRGTAGRRKAPRACEGKLSRWAELRDGSKRSHNPDRPENRKGEALAPAADGRILFCGTEGVWADSRLYRWELCIPCRGISRRPGPRFFQGRPGLCQFRAPGRSSDLREFRVKTDIETREKTNHTVFVPGWPIGSFPEVSVWIAAGSSRPASRLGMHPVLRRPLTGKPAGSAVI